MLIIVPNNMPIITLAQIAAQLGYAVKPAGYVLQLVPFGPPRHCDDVTVGEIVNGEITFPPEESTEDELIAAACKRFPAPQAAENNRGIA